MAGLGEIAHPNSSLPTLRLAGPGRRGPVTNTLIDRRPLLLSLSPPPPRCVHLSRWRGAPGCGTGGRSLPQARSAQQGRRVQGALSLSLPFSLSVSICLSLSVCLSVSLSFVCSLQLDRGWGGDAVTNQTGTKR